MSKRNKNRNTQILSNVEQKLKYGSVAILIFKIAIISRISAFNFNVSGEPFSIDGAWLGADGENYLTGFKALVSQGVYSEAGILNYWPAGYPLILYFLTLFGKSWVLTTLSIFQTLILLTSLI